MLAFFRKRKFFIIMASVVLVALGMLISYNNVSTAIRNSRVEALSEQQDAHFEHIYTYLLQLTLESSAIADDAANGIQQDLATSFNITNLKAAFDSDSDIYKTQIHDIYRRYTEGKELNDVDNHRNGFMILSGNLTIEENYTLDIDKYKTPDSSSGTSHKYTLMDYKKNSYNTKLLEDAIWKLKNQSEDIIAIEPYDYINSDNHTLITEMSYESLKKVYKNEGLEGLKNYEFLVPTYITDTGDLFGTPDISEGVPQNTHKIIVIQCFNLYDQLMATQQTFQIDADRSIDHINNRYDSILYTLNLFSILVVILLILLIFFCFTAYNNYIEHATKNMNADEDK